MLKFSLLFLTLASTSLAATSPTQPATEYGPNPTLASPTETGLIPTVNIAPAVGWPSGTTPIPAPGLKVEPFATNLDHPRWLYRLPNGDILVAESNKPQPKDEGFSIRKQAQKVIQSRAGAGVPSANRITLLRDADQDGKPELRVPFLEGLNSPLGMALINNTFYVANADSLVSFPYRPGLTNITASPTLITHLPGHNSFNHHWTKNLIASRDGTKLYISVGSNSNVAENGMEAETNRAAILEYDLRTKVLKPYATGLRNPVGMAWEPTTGALTTVVNERDELGDDLVPDYITTVKPNAFYGWPYSYFGQHLDTRVEPQNPALVARAIKPDYALGAHTASLGLTFTEEPNLTTSLPFKSGVFIGQHGSWNRSELAGYKVIFLPFANGKPTGQPVDVLTGFVNRKGQAQGRPVGVTLDLSGALLVADDTGNTIWRVTKVQ